MNAYMKKQGFENWLFKNPWMSRLITKNMKNYMLLS